MSLAGATVSVIKLIEDTYTVRHGGPDGLTFKVLVAHAVSDETADQVSIIVYRVELDPTRRYDDRPPRVPGGERRRHLVVDIRFLLVVWIEDPIRELQVLQECMEILEETPVLTGSLLDPRYATWEPDSAIRVCIDTMGPEESLRLWDALNPSYRVGIPYILRTVRLAPNRRMDGPLVTTSTRHYVPALPPEGT